MFGFQIVSIVSDLEGVVEALARGVVDDLSHRVEPALEATLGDRPMLLQRVRELTAARLSQSYEDTVQRMLYLVRLEQNVTYDEASMEVWLFGLLST